MNLGSLLLDHPFDDAENLLHTVDRSVTAGAARQEALATAEQLRAAGLTPGQGVAVQMPNGPELITTLMAVWIAKGLFIPLNPRMTDAERAGILATAKPALLVTRSGIQVIPKAATYDPETAFVMWTSGTSGAPKAVHHTHSAYFELLDRVLGPLRGGAAGTKTPSPNLIPVSLALNAGIYNSLFGLRAGAALVIMDGFEARQFAELVRRFQIRSTVLPPAAMAMLSDDPGVSDLGPLKYVRSITAPLSPLQAKRFAAKFPVTILNGYGQVEIGEVIGWTAADAREHPDKLGAIGKPHPGVAIKLDGDGQLLVRPPNKAVGLEDRVDAEGYVATGDIARIDEDGFVWIEGRAGDVINRGGNKVFPDAVEEVLRLSPAVDDAAVVGAPDGRLGEIPVAYLLGRPVPDAELIALCRANLVPFKVPVAFRWVDSFPRSEAGKILRRELSAREAPRT